MSDKKQPLKMIIDGDNPDGLLTVMGGKSLSWPVNRTWNVLKKKETDRIFGEINTYIASKPNKFSTDLYGLYEEARRILNATDEVKVLIAELRIVSEKVLAMFDYPSMLALAKKLISSDNIFIEKSMIKATNTKYSPERTYVLDEYVGLVALTLCIKPLTPIWALYNKAASPIVGTKFKEMLCLDFINRSPLAEQPGYTKLEIYVETIGERFMNGSVYAVTKSIPKADLPKYFLAFTVVRKLAQADLSTENLVTSVFKAVNDQGSTFQTNLKMQSMSINSDDAKDSSVGDYKGTPESIKGHYFIMAGETAKLYQKMLAKELDNPNEEEKAKLELYYSQLVETPTYITRPAFFSIVGCALRTMSPKAVFGITDHGKLAAIAVAAVKLEHYGFYDLSLFIRSVATVTDTDTMQSGIVSTNHFSLKKELEVCYPKDLTLSEKKPFLSPGHQNILSVENFINGHEISCGKENILDIQNSIAKLLILRSKGKF